MTLEKELARARKDVVTDGYEMSLGEIVSLYRDGELQISPAFQRYFRWDAGRKTRFIESLLLGIPIPPIFVFQTNEGAWELVDGLQRLSTILEFMGVLNDDVEVGDRPLALDGTKLLPSLAGCSWDGSNGTITLSSAQKLDIRRSRLRVEILKRESDPTSKFELFQRLNTGGASLSEQEVRNCTLVMIRPEVHSWISELTANETFRNCLSLSENQLEKQQDVELVLRFLSFRRVPYTNGIDVHEYLDDAAITIAMDDELDKDQERRAFETTFRMINEALGDKSFRRWNGSKFSGKFLISVFEVLATGVAANIDALEKMEPEAQKSLILERAKELWQENEFTNWSGAGVRGSSRLAHLLPFAKTYMKP